MPLLNFGRPSNLPRTQRRLLAVFDGGNAPGYSSVAVALTEEGARRGYEVWAATEGFRSLTEDANHDLRFERLVVDRRERYALLGEGVPARSMGRRVLDPGSDFRSERYGEFLEKDRRDQAAQTFLKQGFTHLICVGGNGTFEGVKAMLDSFEPAQRPPAAFVNISVDNDVGGDRAIGFLTGVEEGAKVARALLEDAYTHKRIYILEMMGNRSGRHALHCGVAARAHLIVLPRFRLEAPVLEEIANALNEIDYALVVVAEGYERERRKAAGKDQSASVYFAEQLAQYGLVDGGPKRVIAEPFSRYLRGIRPHFVEVSGAYLKASLLFEAFDREETEIMPYVLAAHDVGVRNFASVGREDRVEPAFLPLLDRLGLLQFQDWIRSHYATDSAG